MKTKNHSSLQSTKINNSSHDREVKQKGQGQQSQHVVHQLE